MATLTVRRLEADTHRRLRIRAAQHGRSTEEEVREILREAVSEVPGAEPDLVTAIRARLGDGGGADLPLPAREPMREPPDFS